MNSKTMKNTEPFDQQEEVLFIQPTHFVIAHKKILSLLRKLMPVKFKDNLFSYYKDFLFQHSNVLMGKNWKCCN